jgi:hypothetical protein
VEFGSCLGDVPIQLAEDRFGLREVTFSEVLGLKPDASALRLRVADK